MRSTKAFFIGAGAAYVLGRATRSRRRDDLDQALQDLELSIDDGVATLRGSVESPKQADDLVEHVARLPGVHDVAAMLRVSGESKKAA